MNCPPEIAEILAEILRTGLLRIRAFGWSKDAARCAIEADHLHNLPSLLTDYSEDRLRYYWDAERGSYLDRSEVDLAAQFEPLWQRLDAVAMLNETPVPAI